MSKLYSQVGTKELNGVEVPVFRDHSPKASKVSASEPRYTHDEVKALRFMARKEILDEMEERLGGRYEYALNDSIVEDRLKTYILAGLKP